MLLINPGLEVVQALKGGIAHLEPSLIFLAVFSPILADIMPSMLEHAHEDSISHIIEAGRLDLLPLVTL